MQRLEVSIAVRLVYVSLGVKGLMLQQIFYGAPRPKEIPKYCFYSEVKFRHFNNSSGPNNLVAVWKNNQHKLKKKTVF